MESRVLTAVFLSMVLTVANGGTDNSDRPEMGAPDLTNYTLCYECMAVTPEHSDISMDKFLKKLYPPNQGCRDGDTKNMTAWPCSGKCVDWTANVTGSDRIGEYTLDVMDRGCDLVPWDTTDDCTSLSEQYITNLKARFYGSNLVTGQRCNSSIPTMDCFQCTDISVAGINSDQACRYGDTNKMQTRPCIGQCKIFVANLTGSDDRGEYKMNMVTRTCDITSSRATDDCIEIPDARVNDFKKEMPGITSVDGQECYCSTDKCNLTPVTSTQDNNGQVPIISCFECSDITVVGGSDTKTIKQLIQQIQPNQACRDGDPKKMLTVPCPGKCMSTIKNVIGSDDGEEYKVNFVSRRCDMMPWRESEGCQKIPDARKGQISSITSIEGQECYCSADKCNLTPYTSTQDTPTQDNNGQVMLTPALTTSFSSLVMAFYLLCFVNMY